MTTRLLAALVLMTWPCYAAPCGDCNASGNVSIVDALEVAQHSAALILIDSSLHSSCDVDGSGNLAILDALMIARHSSGQATGLNCGAPPVTTWTEIQPSPSPAPSISPLMVFDEVRGVTLYVVGDYSGTIWEWDGAAWTSRTPAGSVPPGGTYDRSIAFDSGRGVVVHTAGDQTWEWDGQSWTRVFTAIFAIPPSLPSMAYDPTRGVCVLVDMFSSYEFDGITWTQAGSPPPVPGLFDVATYFDAVRGKVVRFHSCPIPGLPQLWELDGASWSLAAEYPTFEMRVLCAVAWDSTRQEAVCFGGFDDYAGRGDYDDTLALVGSAWQTIPVANAPPARDSHGMVYDSVRDRMVVFGGSQDMGVFTFGDTWELTR